MRYLRFRAWLDSTPRTARVGVIHFEEVRRHAGTDSGARYGGLLATLTVLVRAAFDIAYQGVPVGTIKRFIVGKGNVDKATVIAAVRDRGFASYR